MKPLLLLSFLLALSSCGDDTFRKVEQLDRFRILAVTATESEVPAGGASTLSLLASDPKGPGGGRLISGTLTTCIDPGVGRGAEVKCDHDPNRSSSAYSFNTNDASFTSFQGTGLTPGVAVTVPATILTGRSSRDQANGVGFLAIFEFTVDGAPVKAFRRITATTRATRNSNPSISALQVNGAAFAGRPVKDDLLSLTTSSPESFEVINVDGTSETRLEDLQVAWYTTNAELSAPKAGVSERVKLTSEPEAGAYLIVAVLRDERGGVAVLRQVVP